MTTFDTRTQIEKELWSYEQCPDAPKDENILSWWNQNKHNFPTLSKFERKYLAIPASSTKSKCVFSTGGNVVTAKRSRLEPDMVEQLVVCHENVSLIKEFGNCRFCTQL